MSDAENDFVDDEAPEDDEERGDRGKGRTFEDSSEEGDEDQDRFEKDDFIVDGDDDDEDGDDGGDDDGDDDGGAPAPKRGRSDHRRKRRRHNDFDDELDEEDLLMLKEGGVDTEKRKKLKRLKKHTEYSGEDDDDDRNLGDDDAYGGYERERGVVDEDVDDEDVDDDFIDDGGGRARRRRKRKDVGGVSSDAVAAARNVFGDFQDVRSTYQPAGRARGDRDGDGGGSEDGDERRGSGRRRRRGDNSGDDNDDDDEFGDGSLSDREDEDGSDDEGGRGGRGKTARRGTKITAEDVAQAAAIASKMSLGSALVLSAEDTKIIEIDIPERLQQHLKGRSTVTVEEIALEADWIYTHAFETDFSHASLFRRTDVVAKIVKTISYIHMEKMDIPFIAQYRKDYVSPELLYPCGDPVVKDESGNVIPKTHPKGFNSVQYPGFSDTFSFEHKLGVDPGFDDRFGDWTPLWMVLDWDKKWADMISHRDSVLALITSCKKKGVPSFLTEKADELVARCTSDVQLGDVERYIRLATEAALALRGRDEFDIPDRVEKDAIVEDEVAAPVGRKRPNSRRSQYSDCHRKGYGLLSVKFGINSTEFADNLEGAILYAEDYQVHVPRDAEGSPMEMARFVQDELRGYLDVDEDKAKDRGLSVDIDAERILKAARMLLVREFLSEPRVVKVAREKLDLEGVKVSAAVTPIGMSAVGETHALRGFVNIVDKPISAFANTPDFAFIQKASDRGYCNISFRFEEERERALRKALLAAVQVSDASSQLVQDWNSEREIVADEVWKGLLKRLKLEASEMLFKATEDCLRVRVFHSASRRLLQGPCTPLASDEGAPRVMAIVVTHEGDEDPDPAQVARETETSKATPGSKPFSRPYGARCTFVNLDQNGSFLGSHEVFGKWLTRNATEKLPPKPLMGRIQAFLMKSKPQVIVVGLGSGGKEAIRLRGDMLEIVADLLPHQGKADFMFGKKTAASMADGGPLTQPGWDEVQQRNVEDPRWAILQKHIISVPDEISRVHAVTVAAGVALPQDGMTMLEKRGIALGRLVQTPLSVYAGIASDPDVASRLQFHRLHFALRPELRVEALQRALTRSVCVMGVDINRLLYVPHLQPMLSFVGGLGPKKAGSIIRKMEQTLDESEENTAALRSRKHLILLKYIEKNVHTSSAGFLRVRDPSLHFGGSTKRAIKVREDELRSSSGKKSKGRRGNDREEGSDFDFFVPLDDSRVHPENYSVAVKIADEALRDDNGELDRNLVPEGTKNLSERVIPIVMKNPEGLRNLDLEKYAGHLEKLGKGLLHETIKMIAFEFQNPFQDTRVILQTPHLEAEFYLATGADIASFRIGSEVTASDCMVVHSGAGIKCRLPFKLRGFLRKTNFFDSHPSSDPAVLKGLVPTGSDLAARIIDFKFEAFECELSSKPSVLKNPCEIEKYVPAYDVRDPYIRAYENRKNPFADPVPVKNRRHRRNNLAKGVTGHDYYHEYDHPTAISHLRDLPVGEFVIRPSSTKKSESDEQYVFTAKFADKFPKVEQGILNVAFSVKNAGNDEPVRYIINKEEFDSVDELLENFLNPLVENMGEAVNHVKFRVCNEDKLKDEVRAMKAKEGKKIPYALGLKSKQLYLVLAFIPGRTSVFTDEIKVKADGFQLRKQMHPSLSALFAWFKKNFRETGPAGGPTMRAAVVPVARPAQPPNPMAGATPLDDELPPNVVPHFYGQPQDRGGNRAVPVAAYGGGGPPPPPPPPPVVAASNPVSYLQGNRGATGPGPAPQGQGMDFRGGGMGYPTGGGQGWSGRPAQGRPAQQPPFRQEAYGQAPPQQFQHRGPPPGRDPGPPPGPPPGGPGGPPGDAAAARRGQLPIPAWKKIAMQQQENGQQQ